MTSLVDSVFISLSLLLSCDPSGDKKRWKWEEKQFIKIYFTTESLSWKWPVDGLALIGQLWPSSASDWLLRLNGARWHLSDTNSRDNQPWPRALGTMSRIQPLMTRRINNAFYRYVVNCRKNYIGFDDILKVFFVSPYSLCTTRKILSAPYVPVSPGKILYHFCLVFHCLRQECWKECLFLFL